MKDVHARNNPQTNSIASRASANLETVKDGNDDDDKNLDGDSSTDVGELTPKPTTKSKKKLRPPLFIRTKKNNEYECNYELSQQLF